MTTVPEGSVIIPPAQVYEKVVTLTEVVTKLVAADEAEANDRADLRTRVGQLEADVNAIKQRLWFVAGICSALGGGLGSALASALGQ